MTEFKNYYKFPLKQEPVLKDTIMTADNEMAFQFVDEESYQAEEDKHNLLLLSPETQREILHAINTSTKVQQYFPDVNIEGEYIKSGNKTILWIRGWGNLTGIGGYALRVENAKLIQNQFALYIVNCLIKKQ